MPTAMALSPLRHLSDPTTHLNRSVQLPILNATNTPVKARAWPDVPFQWPINDNLNLKITSLHPQVPAVHDWTIETALLDIYTNISFFRNPNDRLSSQATFNSDNGIVDVIVEFFIEDSSRAIRFRQAGSIVDAIGDLTQKYGARQIARADVVFVGRMAGRVRMSFVPSIIVMDKLDENVTVA